MTKTVRISVPITLETQQALDELAEVTGAKVGPTAASFLNEMAPSILRLAEAYRAAKLDPRRGAELVNNLADESRSLLDEEQTKLNEKVKK